MKINPIKDGDLLEVYVDGASRGNPGPAAWAFIFVKDNETFHQKSGYLGDATNNTAEYNAIINALKEAEKYTRWQVNVYSDSQLAIRQINRKYRIKKAHLSKLCEKIYKQRSKFELVKFFHVNRSNSFIQVSDSLCNECLDEKGF
jgi:ribonuclease HI